MLRGRYNCADSAVCKRIVQAFEEGEDWRVVAKHNGVKYKTAYNCINAKELQHERQPKSGGRKKTLNDTEVDEMITWLEEDPTIALELLRIRIKAEFEIEVSRTTVGDYLKCRLISIKKLHLIPYGMNNADTKVIRQRRNEGPAACPAIPGEKPHLVDSCESQAGPVNLDCAAEVPSAHGWTGRNN
ncbi:unnamed protein product [Echinostoma caproni]|uniref:HTH_33 domain-containing protein n=1 Tax=Echinostoma caproni TaxID=27848 RepID=A0A183AZP0_9TREM|nr:unnamed protein product [Echinostoma caproni]